MQTLKEVIDGFKLSEGGRSFLHALAARGQAEPQKDPLASCRATTTIARAMLKAGADPSPADYHGYTPLHLAAARGDDALARLLVREGANVEARTVWGDTPLYVATFWNRPSVARILLDAGADTEATNDAGNSPQTLVEEHGDPAAFAVLREAPHTRIPRAWTSWDKKLTR